MNFHFRKVLLHSGINLLAVSLGLAMLLVFPTLFQKDLGLALYFADFHVKAARL